MTRFPALKIVMRKPGSGRLAPADAKDADLSNKAREPDRPA